MNLLTLCCTHSELMLLTCTWTHFGEVVNIYKRKSHRCFAAMCLTTISAEVKILAAHILLTPPTNTKASEKQNPSSKTIFPLSHLCTCFSLLLSLLSNFYLSLTFSFPPHFHRSQWLTDPMFLLNWLSSGSSLRKKKVQSQQKSEANIITNQFS